jgi:hypothetical protein
VCPGTVPAPGAGKKNFKKIRTMMATDYIAVVVMKWAAVMTEESATYD